MIHFAEKTMKKTAILKTLGEIPIFSVLSDNELEEFAESGKTLTYKTGDVIAEKNELLVILKGSVTVSQHSGEKKLLMRILSVGSVFGVASLFSDVGKSPSILTAASPVELLAVGRDEVEDMLRKNGDFSMAYISFLTSRIRFLNGRIRACTAGDTESRLAFHLLISDEVVSNEITVPVSFSALADMLDMGRASLYRAVLSLTERGIISRSGKTIKILDRSALRRICDGQL